MDLRKHLCTCVPASTFALLFSPYPAVVASQLDPGLPRLVTQLCYCFLWHKMRGLNWVPKTECLLPLTSELFLQLQKWAHSFSSLENPGSFNIWRSNHGKLGLVLNPELNFYLFILRQILIPGYFFGHFFSPWFKEKNKNRNKPKQHFDIWIWIGIFSAH